ncbi:MAG: RNA methyltransferase [Clostridia bacterium]|nr:RNA methyltransferase [Clostridia bacterium]
MAVFSEISSKDNKYLKYVSKLQTSAKFRNTEQKFVIEGLRICLDAMQNHISFEVTLVSETFYDKFKKESEVFFANSRLNFKIKDSLFQKISDTKNPQGVIAVAEIPENKFVFDKSKKYVALDNIADPSNLGAVSRTAEALGVGGIVLTNDGCDPYSPKVLRASMGTILRMPIFVTDNLPMLIKSNNIRAISCVVDEGAEKIGDIKFNNGDMIIIGNEANGVTNDVKDASEILITIPMTGRAESLNAAAAAAIAIYELTK